MYVLLGNDLEAGCHDIVLRGTEHNLPGNYYDACHFTPYSVLPLQVRPTCTRESVLA